MKISKPAEGVFFEALAKNSAQDRAAFLNSPCNQDAGLRNSVARLLNALPSSNPNGVMGLFRVERADDPVSPNRIFNTSETLTDIAKFRGAAPAKLPKLASGELDWIVMTALDKN